MTDMFIQENRLLSIETPLGPNKLLMRALTGHEGISQLFQFQLDLLSEDGNINFDQIVGQNVNVDIKLADNETKRYFNGFVSRFSQLPNEGQFAHYQAEMVPWLWFLTRTTDCLIFQNRSIPDIIQQVFQSFGFSDFELDLRRTYQEWEYCVQYRETACNFVMRLMEQEGIFFFFKHQKGKHILVMADSPAAHKPCPDQSKVRYEHSAGPGIAREEDTINSWQMEHELRPGKYAINDFYFETPSTSLLSSIEGQVTQGGNKKYEVYDYPGEYEKRGEGDSWVRLRIEEEETPHAVITGSGGCRSLVSGFRFDLSEHTRKDQNGTYVLTTISHNAHEGGTYTGIVGTEASYTNIFTCIKHSITFRPPRVSPRPLMQGVQTATVVGPPGEEIYVDKYGRVKVQFHWDRVGKHNEKSSCWIRVSHPWAGKNWGAVAIPRMGQEVVVDFLEGDPDRPLIVGRVYNAEQMPPYDLPGNKTQTGIKSRSSLGGTPANFNEIRFEDKKGQEQVYIHAERNKDTLVEHDETITVQNNRTITVDGTHTETIKKQTKITITEGTYTHDVAANTAHYHVKAALTEDYDATQTTLVAKEIKIVSEEATIHVVAAEEIMLHTGASTLTMKKDGTIRLYGKDILIAGTQEVKSAVGTQSVTCDTQKVGTSGAKINSTAVGMHEISGALIKIN
jgi:type VI secretion system secreted protein VgrG